jgi:hypothetical protein
VAPSAEATAVEGAPSAETLLVALPKGSFDALAEAAQGAAPRPWSRRTNNRHRRLSSDPSGRGGAPRRGRARRRARREPCIGYDAVAKKILSLLKKAP